MSTKQITVDYIMEQINDSGIITAKKMFGEYAIYCNGKVVALVCDDDLFVKITPAGKEFAGSCSEKPPYKGAKPYFWIPGDQWEDREWLSHLIRISAAQLSLPKKKRVKR